VNSPKNDGPQLLDQAAFHEAKEPETRRGLPD
jgi:hypothetical protein